MRPVFSAVVLPLLAFGLVRCGGASEPPPAQAPPRPSAARAEPPPAPRPPGVLWREDVVHAVDQGLGRFLQHAEVEPAIEEGQFVGHRIVSLVPPDYWQGIDLRPGDVVMRVNGMPIEQDIDAYRVFVGLKTADALRVSYLRGGAARELTLKIVPRPKR
jgi:S1-C subfamily serine protease